MYSHLLVILFVSLTGLFYKTKNKKNNENATKNLDNDENELSKYRCVKCNLLIYPAKGREQKFLKDVILLYRKINISQICI